MYQQRQEDQASARAMQFARLTPIQQANYAIGRGAYGLAGALGGALGGQDPELQRRTVSQQILGMIDPNRPETFDQAVQMALQSGDQRLAYGLRIEADKFKQQALVRSDEAQIRANRLLAQQQEAEAQRIAQGAYQPGTPERLPMLDVQEREQMADQGTPMPENIAAVAPSFDISRVAPELMRTAAGREQLKNLAAAQKLTMPEVKEVPKGARLLERTPTGWRTVSVTGQPEIQATSENAIQTLIASGAVHPTIVPYAQQIARRFATLDPEDQDKAMQTFTQLNNQATNQELTRTASASAAAGAAESRKLSQELVRLSIADSNRKADAAADGKTLGINDSTKLAERSASADKLVSIYESFKPQFAGFATDKVGDVAIVIAGKSKDPNSVELFQWWQGYQENINKVRNELFGAALTAPEKAEFEKAMVTKGMSPEQASKNLKRQAELSINAYNKLEKVLRVQGFSKAGLDALKPTGIRPGLESFVVPSVPAPAAR
jgi:hypothetical protein